MKTKNNSHSTLHNRQYKGKDFIAQKKAVYKAFKEPSTMLMVSVNARVLRANICRYVAAWKRDGKIKLLHSGTCPVSKRKAGFYTTDENLMNGL